MVTAKTPYHSSNRYRLLQAAEQLWTTQGEFTIDMLYQWAKDHRVRTLPCRKAVTKLLRQGGYTSRSITDPDYRNRQILLFSQEGRK